LFGKRLAELRNKLGISQYELAARMKLSRGQIANYEQGTREPDFNTLIALADFFEVSLDNLLGREWSATEVTNEFPYITYLDGSKEELTEEEVEYLKGNLHLLRQYDIQMKKKL
jgi:transcriptional regulator with XRE-family HTH domain